MTFCYKYARNENGTLYPGIAGPQYSECSGTLWSGIVTWENNIYETAEGIEIYKYEPATAGKLFSSVDSTANDTDPNADLIFIGSWSCDPIGTSYRWVYLYQSSVNQKKYEYWVNDSKVVARDTISIPWMINGFFNPTTEDWIDSDSAMVIAEGLGGTEFRETFTLITVEMAMENYNWDIHYRAQDTVFSINIDAKRE